MAWICSPLKAAAGAAPAMPAAGNTARRSNFVVQLRPHRITHQPRISDRGHYTRASSLVLRKLTANGSSFTALEAESGPLALCLHGFPDSAHTWRHLLPALADTGRSRRS